MRSDIRAAVINVWLRRWNGSAFPTDRGDELLESPLIAFAQIKRLNLPQSPWHLRKLNRGMRQDDRNDAKALPGRCGVEDKVNFLEEQTLYAGVTNCDYDRIGIE